MLSTILGGDLKVGTTGLSLKCVQVLFHLGVHEVGDSD